MTVSADLLTDLSVFLDSDEFGVAATFTPSGGSASSIVVIQDKEYIEIDGFNSSLSSTKPVALAVASDVTGYAKGDSLVIGAITYEVTGGEPDGTGLVLLRLEEQ